VSRHSIPAEGQVTGSLLTCASGSANPRSIWRAFTAVELVGLPASALSHHLSEKHKPSRRTVALGGRSAEGRRGVCDGFATVRLLLNRAIPAVVARQSALGDRVPDVLRFLLKWLNQAAEKVGSSPLKAAGVGFEPTNEVAPVAGFQDRCLQPLGHPAGTLTVPADGSLSPSARRTSGAWETGCRSAADSLGRTRRPGRSRSARPGCDSSSRAGERSAPGTEGRSRARP
jgi:hypothetical protein